MMLGWEEYYSLASEIDDEFDEFVDVEAEQGGTWVVVFGEDDEQVGCTFVAEGDEDQCSYDAIVAGARQVDEDMESAKHLASLK